MRQLALAGGHRVVSVVIRGVLALSEGWGGHPLIRDSALYPLCATLGDKGTLSVLIIPRLKINEQMAGYSRDGYETSCIGQDALSHWVMTSFQIWVSLCCCAVVLGKLVLGEGQTFGRVLHACVREILIFLNSFEGGVTKSCRLMMQKGLVDRVGPYRGVVATVQPIQHKVTGKIILSR